MTRRLLATANALRTACAVVALGAALGAPARVRADDDVAPVLVRPALNSAFAAHVVLLGVARAGKRVVAVGERGIIVLSDDGGQTWRQAAVPVSVTLTTVTFSSPLQGWAAGHSGVILHSTDGGATWRRQLDGTTLARLALQDAQRRVRAHPSDARRRNDLGMAQRLVADGPDKPFLQLHFFDDRRGIAVGAYGLIFATQNGGATWQPWMDRVENPERLHIYAIATRAKNMYLAGEQGFFARSTDGGATFARRSTPYRGTYFALCAVPSGELLVAGLRGNAFRSTDAAATFVRVASPAQVSLEGLAALADGTIALASTSGQLFIWKAGWTALRPATSAEAVLPPLAGVTEAPDGALVVVGMGGALRLPAPRAALRVSKAPAA